MTRRHRHECASCKMGQPLHETIRYLWTRQTQCQRASWSSGEVESGKRLGSVPVEGRVLQYKFSPDGTKFAVVTGAKPYLRVIDVSTCRPIWTRDSLLAQNQLFI